MNPKVAAPTVHLFAFHLYKTPSFQSDSSELEPDNLWDKCHHILSRFGEKQKLDLLENHLKDNPSELRLELLKNAKSTGINSHKFTSEVRLESQPDQLLNLKGFAYPLRIHDSYALGWQIYYPTKENDEKAKTETVDIDILGKFNPDGYLLPDYIDSSLGQTLLITVELTEDQKLDGDKKPESIKELAQQCIEAFIPDPSKRPNLYREGQLFGSAIFEYGLVSQPGIYRHILVWLLRDKTTEKVFERCYHSFLDLFFYRNKIIRAFQDSRNVWEKVYEKYVDIENSISETFQEIPQGISLSEETLKKLNAKLKMLPQKSLEYTRLLRTLESQRNTIALNAQNYWAKVKEISLELKKADCEYPCNPDLGFLETFHKENCSHYQEQIQGDLNYFLHGSGMVDKAIASIRGIVEIEQAERDRRLQDAVLKLTVVGAGLGAGGIFATSYGLYDKQPFVPLGKTFTPHPVTKSLSYSILFGLAVGLLAAWLLRLFPHRNK